MLKNLIKALLSEYCESELKAMDITIFKDQKVLNEIFIIIDSHTQKEQSLEYRHALAEAMPSSLMFDDEELS